MEPNRFLCVHFSNITIPIQHTWHRDAYEIVCECVYVYIVNRCASCSFASFTLALSSLSLVFTMPMCYECTASVKNRLYA